MDILAFFVPPFLLATLILFTGNKSYLYFLAWLITPIYMLSFVFLTEGTLGAFGFLIPLVTASFIGIINLVVATLLTAFWRKRKV
jgi:hypothetical protein